MLQEDADFFGQEISLQPPHFTRKAGFMQIFHKRTKDTQNTPNTASPSCTAVAIDAEILCVIWQIRENHSASDGYVPTGQPASISIASSAALSVAARIKPESAFARLKQACMCRQTATPIAVIAASSTFTQTPACASQSMLERRSFWKSIAAPVILAGRVGAACSASSSRRGRSHARLVVGRHFRKTFEPG